MDEASHITYHPWGLLLMPSATSTRGLARARRLAAADLLNEKAVLIRLMSTADGRRWMWLLLAQCGAFLDIDGPALDSLGRMGQLIGKRSIGLLLMAQVTHHVPEYYLRMTTENTNYKPPEGDNNEEEPDDGRPTDDD